MTHMTQMTRTPPPIFRAAGSWGLAVWLLLAATPLAAQTALHRYPDADIASGEKLVREHQCAACHARKVGGDGSAIYRPSGRINTPAALLTMVERCNTELNLGLFPEDTAAVAAVLQRDHYRFKSSTPAPAVR
jgi:mono/diheme cytochrome c family protein